MNNEHIKHRIAEYEAMSTPLVNPDTKMDDPVSAKGAAAAANRAEGLREAESELCECQKKVERLEDALSEIAEHVEEPDYIRGVLETTLDEDREDT